MFKIPGYSITKKISPEGNSVVYHAQRESDQLKVILKTTKDDQPTLKVVSQFQHEYELLKKIDDPGVSRVIELVFHQRKPVLVIKDNGGESLQKLLINGPLALDSFFKIALQLTKALQYLHQKKIIHKDISTNNIVVEQVDLTAQLIDFGISTQSSLTMQEAIVPDCLEGTLTYMSPEQTGRLNRAIDYRSDFYSLGITFYEMLTGKPPFETEDALEMVYYHLVKNPPSVSSVNPAIPEQVSRIIEKLIDKTPENRYASAIGLQTDLVLCERQLANKKQDYSFPLAQHDICDHLTISQKLYSRDEQITFLTEAFERASSGRCELLLVSGFSGIGKTTLIKEVIKPITRSKGYFISGKFDQFQKTPYRSWVDAFDSLIHTILTESQEKIDLIKASLLAALKSDGQVLTDLIPSLELLIGVQPAVPSLNPTESQGRFIKIFQNFVRVLATDEHPLAIFLDDWQWADNGSQILLKALLDDSTIKNILIIGAYRDNEVPLHHPFTLTINELKEAQVPVTNVLLPPLQERDLAQLVADSLGCELEYSEQLAGILFAKTQGNPFFINEFLRTIYQNGLLKFNYGETRWEWDLDKIGQQTYTDNVINLVTNRVHSLPDQTRDLLTKCACIGHTFDLKILALLTDKTIHEVASDMLIAVDANFIFPVDDKYKLIGGITQNDDGVDDLGKEISWRFVHDRVQQACYALADDYQKKKIHLKVGRFLQDNGGQPVDMVNHLNLSRDLISNKDERHQLAKLNLEAGTIAKKANAYDLALGYFVAGIECLATDCWEQYYELTFELNYERCQSEYLTGNFKIAEGTYRLLSEKAKADEDKVKLYLLISLLYAHDSRFSEATHALSQSLRLLGHELPPMSELQEAIKKEGAQVGQLLQEKELDQLLQAPDATDEKILTVVKVLDRMLVPLQFSNPPMIALVTLRILSLSLRYGNSPYAASGYLWYAIRLIAKIIPEKSDEDRAYQFGRLAIDLSERYSAIGPKGMQYFIYAFFIHYQRNPISDCMPLLKESYRVADEAGDQWCKVFSALHVCTNMISSGEFIDDIYGATESTFSFVKKKNDIEQLICIIIIRQFLQFLRGETETFVAEYENYKGSKLLTYLKDNKFFRPILIHHLLNVYYFHLTGNSQEALKSHAQLEFIASEGLALGVYLWMIHHFIYPLTLAGIHHDLSETERSGSLSKLDNAISLLRSRAKGNPDNYLNKYLLAQAERARITGDTTLAIQCYVKSIQTAKQQGFIHEEAIAQELFGKFYLALGDTEAAHTHLRFAHQKFGVWGAKAKAKHLEELYPAIHWDLQKNTKTTTQSIVLNSEKLDLTSAVKASQAISSEINLESLLEKLVSILLESAGAQRCLLMTKKAEDWVVEIESTGGSQKMRMVEKPSITKYENIPLSLINYVTRTKKPVVLGDAGSSEYARVDPYLANEKPKSVLVLPLQNHGTFNNLIYLENNQTTDAFTQDHLYILEFLASQAAISLQNARLYYDATHDHMTGLANRNLLESTFDTVTRSDNQFLGVIFADLDYFKKINDTLGHEVGDKLLIYIAQQLNAATRPTDLVVRLGGDEFVVLLQGVKNKKQITEIVDRFYTLLSVPVTIQGHVISPSSSMGISLYPSNGQDIQTLLKHADDALYQVKQMGKNHYRFYATA